MPRTSAIDSNSKWSIIAVLGQPYALEILDALSKKPLRYTDLKVHAPNERTRTNRLKMLEEKGLIETSSIKVAKRYFVHYSLTERGRVALRKAKEIADIEKIDLGK